MGTFHILDGKKVKVFFTGNRSTCGWCKANDSKFQGGVKAKICKVHIEDHMRELWSAIKFDPRLPERGSRR